MNQEKSTQDEAVSLDEVRAFMKRGRPIHYDQGVVPLRGTSVTTRSILERIGLVGSSKGVYVGGTRMVDLYETTDLLLDRYIEEAERRREKVWFKIFGHDKRALKKRFIRYNEYLALFEKVSFPTDIGTPEGRKYFYSTYPAYEYFGITNDQDRRRVCQVLTPDRERWLELFLLNNSTTTKHFFFVDYRTSTRNC